MHQRRPGSRQRNARRVNRRTAMQIGGLGAAGFGLADLLRARSQASSQSLPRETSVVWVWLQGGAPHLETFDPKMDAPSGYRSMIGALSTRLPGVEFGGLFPGLAGSANRMAVVRSFHHTNPDHLGASHYVLTANDNPGGSTQQTKPSFGAIASRVRGTNHPRTRIPTFVRLKPTVSFDFDQPLWLGRANAPFDVAGGTRKNLNLSIDPSHLANRRGLLHQLDRLRRDLDQTDAMAGMDAFEQQATDLILGKTRDVFDLTQETPALRARYGDGLGEQLLTARRLCEAGCGFVTLTYGWAPQPAKTPFAWDMHLGPSQPAAPPMDQQLRAICPPLDHALAVFLEDVAERGLDKNILLVLTGDFGRTPKINAFGGRDHWPGLSTLALAGGGLQMGQVVGTSSARGEFPTSSPVQPKDLMATLFHVLGVPPKLQFPDYSGRPHYLLPEGASPISELL
ncbi:MAG: DUF1501 domain-containing protein [Pirellulales bacterium]|nr:DUF1501 domain-containing protein [Pirellulales bacterium]